MRQLIERVADTITGYGEKGGYFKTAADRDAFHDELTAILVNQVASFNSPVWFNVGIEPQPAGLGLLHQLVRRLDGLDPRARQDRGHALQVRLGHGLEPLVAPRLARGPLGRRHRVRPALLHEGLRLLRGRDQVGRQDAPRGQDGDPEHRPPGHRGLRRLQGERGEEGLGADRRRLRRLVQRRGVRVDLLPEREPLGARHRRVHGGRRERRRVADEGGPDGPAVQDLQGARPHGQDRGLRVDLRRSGHAVRHDDQPLEPGQGDAPHQRVEPVLASTCSWTTRPATSRR